MERRKSRILIQFEDIKEEKKSLEENLEKVLNQVFSCVDHVKNFSNDVKQKDCSLILSYELGVLKKLTEINFELESIIESNPLAQLQITEKKFESNSDLPNQTENINEASSEELVNSTLNQQSELLDDVDFNVAACPNYISDLLSGNYNIETQSNFSDTEIQREFRDSLIKFSKKLGINDESISCMKDYYDKPSTSCTFDHKPSSSHNQIDYSIKQTSGSKLEVVSNDFEIPEKDTSVAVNCESNIKEENFSVVIPLIETAKTHTEDSIALNDECEDKKCASGLPQNILCAETSSGSTDLDVFNCTKSSESSSSKYSTKEEPTHCQATDADLLLSTKDNECKKTDDTVDEPKKIVYTALEKLNNTKILDRHQEALDKIINKPLPLPDLKLKPTESQVIKNELEVKSKLKKKKNKKKDCEKDSVLYELKRKPAPVMGTECVFSHVESPSEFYIHIVDEESAVIDALTEQINEYFQNTVSDYSTKEDAYTCIGKYCFVFISEYNGWYRAQVLEWYLQSKSNDVFVQLVDYGNKRRTSYKNLRKMSKEMAAYPMLAIRCHLPLMYPPTSTYINRLTEWPPATIDALAGISGLFIKEESENKVFKVVFAQEEGDSVAIDLYNPQDADPEQTVGQILLDMGLAEQIIEQPDEENPELEEFLQDVDSLERADNINEAITGYDPRDEARICRFTKPDGTCFKGKNCKLEHIPLSRDGFTTDKEPVFTGAMDSLSLPQLGDVIIILITSYKDACNFFAQIVKNPHQEKNRALQYNIDAELYSLLRIMNNPKTIKGFERFKIPPAIGEIVIARHRLSKKWLRAVVRERFMWNNDESDEYQVFMLDFGDYLQLPLRDLRKIQPHFLQLPFQAVECYIHNYKAKNDCDPDRVKQFFYKNLYFHNFVAVAMSTSLPLRLGIKTFNGFDIAKTLMEIGFAEKRTCDKNPMDGCPLEMN